MNNIKCFAHDYSHLLITRSVLNFDFETALTARPRPIHSSFNVIRPTDGLPRPTMGTSVRLYLVS